MKRYSTRERILFAVFGVLLLPFAALHSYFMFFGSFGHSVGTWLGFIGLWGLSVLFLKIAVTGTSASFFERRMDGLP